MGVGGRWGSAWEAEGGRCSALPWPGPQWIPVLVTLSPLCLVLLSPHPFIPFPANMLSWSPSPRPQQISCFGSP